MYILPRLLRGVGRRERSEAREAAATPANTALSEMNQQRLPVSRSGGLGSKFARARAQHKDGGDAKLVSWWFLF